MGNLAIRLHETLTVSDDVYSEAAMVERAQRQYGKDFDAYLQDHGLVDDTRTNRPPAFIDIMDRNRDPRDIVVLHQPMANALYPHRKVVAAGLGGMFKDRRIVTRGNDGNPGSKHLRLSHADRAAIAQGDLSPYIIDVINAVNALSPRRVTHVGDSLGAELAITASQHTNAGEVSVVAIEPVRVVDRSLLELGKAFKSTEEHLQGYLDANDQEVYEHAFREKGGSEIGYPMGLARLSNLAISRGLTTPRFGHELHGSLRQGVKVSVSWGGSSELALIGAGGLGSIPGMDESTVRSSFVDQVVIPGEAHAMTNDLGLLNAIVGQSVRDLES